MLLVQLWRKLCAVSQTCQCPSYSSCFSFLSVIFKISSTLCFCTCGSPPFPIGYHSTIASIAFGSFYDFLTSSFLAIPDKSLNRALFLSIVLQFFCFDSALWTLLPEPN